VISDSGTRGFQGPITGSFQELRNVTVLLGGLKGVFGSCFLRDRMFGVTGGGKKK